MFSPYLIAIAVTWIVAQGAKYIISIVRSGSIRNYRQLYLSGNMPSAHSASVVALLTMIGGLNGVDSAIFAVAALFAAIVMYDSVMVRRSSGEQGESLKALLKEQKSRVRIPRVAKGHTPLEVAVGALFGLVVGLIMITVVNAGL